MKKLFFILFICSTGLGAAWAQQVHKSLNVVFIMADDMGYGDPQCYNPESKIPTPNMNRLAEEGLLFTDAHSASSVCTPSRYSVITGDYAWRSPMKKEVSWSGYSEPLIRPDEKTVADLFKEKGYRTAAIGKWHLGINFLKKTGNEFVDPKDYHEKALLGSRNVNFLTPTFGGPNVLGFDYFFGSAGGQNMEPHAFIRNRYTVGMPTVWRESRTPTVSGTSASEVHEGWMVPEWNDTAIGPALTQEALAFIEESHQQEKPFFLYYTPVAPHRPCTPSTVAKGKSEAGERGDMVFEFDWSVGQVMNKLEELGLKENTLLIVTSDNGATRVSDDGKDYGHKSCGILNGYKGSLLEGGHRVPFIARWPDVIQPGETTDALVSNIDLLATIADIFGEPILGKDSKSFYSILINPQLESLRHDLIHHTYSGMYAIRDGDWKLIPHRSAKDGTWSYQLFNLRNDPYEKDNLNEQYPKKLADLKRKLDREILQ